jgi:hypothetical protein
MEYYYFWFFLFAIVAYLIVTDQSVSKLFDFSIRLLKFEYEKTKWWFLYNPRNPIVKYLIWRNSMKMAREIQKEFENDKLR